MKRILAITLAIFLVSCAPMVNPVPTQAPTSTLNPTKTPLPAPTETPIPILSFTPIPVEFMTLGSPFDIACGIPLLIVDNSFNGIQGEYDNNHGHFDIWTSDCDPNTFDGEVIAPVSGTLTKRNAENVYALCLPNKTYITGMTEAMQFAGINNPRLEQIQELCIDLGHLKLLPNIQLEQKVEKGQRIGNLVYNDGGISPKLAYQIVFVYQDKFYMTSPTIYKHDAYYPMNFNVPNDPIYDVIYPDGESPWLFDPHIKNIMGNSWADYYNYPEPMAYP